MGRPFHVAFSCSTAVLIVLLAAALWPHLELHHTFLRAASVQLWSCPIVVLPYSASCGHDPSLQGNKMMVLC